jgi:hypothetical protein
MRIAGLLALACTLAWSAPQESLTHAAPACGFSTQVVRILPGRVDSLTADATTGTVIALVGQPASRVRFLPHDSVLVLEAGDVAAPARSITIPAYVTAPGFTVATNGRRFYVLVDSTLLTLDGASGRVISRQDLRMQAIGWPAAMVAGRNGDVYLVGQPSSSWVAEAYDFKPDRHQVLHQQWHAPLGTMHAGTWMGLAGTQQLAVYIPDQSDAQGTVALLDLNSGTVLRSFAVHMAPTAADASHDRLFLAGTGTIRVLALDSGAPVAATGGDAPLAVSSALGLVAFVDGNRLVLARVSTMQTELRIPFPTGAAPTALAWQGSSLVVGTAHSVIRLQLDGCP